MNIGVISDKCGFFGGIERYIYSMTQLLNDQFNFYALFKEDASDASQYRSIFTDTLTTDSLSKGLRYFKERDIDLVIIHKADSKLFAMIHDNFKYISVIHDHDYYCFRHHKYFLHNRKNCSYKQSFLRCSACSLLIENRKGGKAILNPFEKIERLQTVLKSDAIVVLSQFMRDTIILNGCDSSKISVVHPFIAKREKPVITQKSSTLQLLFASQIIRGKGLAKLISLLKNCSTPFHLTVVGKGSDEARCKEICTSFHLDENISFIGFTSNIEALYKKSDLIIFPSLWQEPFGLVGIEAFSYGKSVIAFDNGGVTEWLQNG